MNERERLAELINAAKERYLTMPLINACKPYFIYFLADHLLANGVIVPPCKVGDTVYRIVEMGTGIHYKQVGRCGIGHAKGYKIAPCEEKTKRFIRSVVVTKNNFFDVYENWGKTVFLTREEAEKARAERSKR